MLQERRYQLQAQEANEQIQAILEGLQIPGDRRLFYAQLLTTVLKMYEDGADLGDSEDRQQYAKRATIRLQSLQPLSRPPESHRLRIGAHAADIAYFSASQAFC